MSQQEADTFKIYARYLADDLVAEALEGKAIEVNAAAPQMAYPGPERRQGGRVPLAVRMKDDPQVVALLKESR
jgi:hypothetical protein